MSRPLKRRNKPNRSSLLEQAWNHLTAGRWDEAEQHYRNLLAQTPQDPDLLHFMGIIAHQRGQLEQAVMWISRAVAIHPGFAEAHNNLGLALEGLQRWQEAASSHRRALTLQPRLAASHNNLGNVLRQQGKPGEAIACFHQALTLQPDYFQAYNNLGNAHADLGQWDEAIACYQKALTLHPHFTEARHNLERTLNHKGLLALEQRHWHEAATCFETMLHSQPGHVEALSHLGIIYQELGRLEEAVVCLQQVAQRRPNLAATYSHWGLALQKMGQHTLAAEQMEHALRIDPNDCGTLTNLGFVRQEQGDVATALALYHRALALDPQFAEAHFGKGLAHLLLGEFTTGWQHYEWRWKKWDFTPHGRPEPLWDGKDLQGETLLIHCEQGFGDSLQFIRLAALVRQRGARVAVLCPQPLEALFRSLKGIDFLASRPEALPRCACQIPLLSLAGVLQVDPATLVTDMPYLHADPVRQQRFLDIGQRKGFKVGLVWRGHRGHKNDRNRSIALHRLAPLFAVTGCLFFSVQKDPEPNERALLAGRDNVHDLSDRLVDFADTAAVLMMMDRIIAVDTAVLHLAGALGRPAWGMLPFVPDWRWLLFRDDSPWYPTVRLFRQRQSGDWDGVITRIREALAQSEGGSVGIHD
ncbi:MAG: tetratricopeptide repeat protein [Magnetococcales bacterium]|nr:tetratricopeptide repeat protein [Magnetococcales bacterium]